MSDESTLQQEPEEDEPSAGLTARAETQAAAGSPAVPPVPQSPGVNRRGRWIALALLFLGVGLVVLFGLRTVRAWRHFDDVRGRPMADDLTRLRPWMTLPDVARDYLIPLDVLYEELGVEPRTPDRRTLRDLNRLFAQGQRGYFENEVRGVIEAYRRAHPPAPPPAGQPPANPAPPQGGGENTGARAPAQPSPRAGAAAIGLSPAPSRQGGAP